MEQGGTLSFKALINCPEVFLVKTRPFALLLPLFCMLWWWWWWWWRWWWLLVNWYMGQWRTRTQLIWGFPPYSSSFAFLCSRPWSCWHLSPAFSSFPSLLAFHLGDALEDEWFSRGECSLLRRLSPSNLHVWVFSFPNISLCNLPCDARRKSTGTSVVLLCCGLDSSLC